MAQEHLRSSPHTRSYVTHPVIIVVMGILAIALGVSAGRAIRRSFASSNDEKATEVRIQELTRERDDLQAEIARAGDPAAVEKAAKAELNQKRPDETAVIVRPPPASATSSAKTESSGWISWLRHLFGR